MEDTSTLLQKHNDDDDDEGDDDGSERALTSRDNSQRLQDDCCSTTSSTTTNIVDGNSRLAAGDKDSDGGVAVVIKKVNEEGILGAENNEDDNCVQTARKGLNSNKELSLDNHAVSSRNHLTSTCRPLESSHCQKCGDGDGTCKCCRGDSGRKDNESSTSSSSSLSNSNSSNKTNCSLNSKYSSNRSSNKICRRSGNTAVERGKNTSRMSTGSGSNVMSLYGSDVTQSDRGQMQPAASSPFLMILSPRKLLDKLLITCPNVEYCQEVLPRRDLQLHLIYGCKGTVTNCVNAHLGCAYRSARGLLHKHLAVCSFEDGQQQRLPPCGTVAQPIIDEQITTIQIYRGCGQPLGLSIVGGIDTPLISVIIQDVYKNGVASRDGRLLPGDQLLEVNGTDLTRASHRQAVQALRRPCTACQLVVYREPSDDFYNSSLRRGRHRRYELLSVTLPKLHGKQLGIKLIQKTHLPGLFILEIIPGGVAYWDNRLRPDDQILEINGEDMSRGSQERAVELIQASTDTVYLVIRRSSSTPVSEEEDEEEEEEGRELLPTPPSPPPPPSRTIQAVTALETHRASTQALLDLSPPSSGERDLLDMTSERMALRSDPTDVEYISRPQTMGWERLVRVVKERSQNLGISIAGGRYGEGGYDTPIYITNIQKDGCVASCRQITKSDILLAINGISLLNLTHAEAVQVLRTVVSSDDQDGEDGRGGEGRGGEGRGGRSEIVLHVVHRPRGEDADDSDDKKYFAPSWKFWLSMPSVGYMPKTITLVRSPSSSLGFSIVGGYTSCYGDVPVFIKSVMHRGPAGRDGRLRSGDRILSVNGMSLDGVTHSNAATLLTDSDNRSVMLTVVSWPGSSV